MCSDSYSCSDKNQLVIVLNAIVQLMKMLYLQKNHVIGQHQMNHVNYVDMILLNATSLARRILYRLL